MKMATQSRFALVVCVFLVGIFSLDAFILPIPQQLSLRSAVVARRDGARNGRVLNMVGEGGEVKDRPTFTDEELDSKEIKRMKKKIEELQSTITSVKEETNIVQETYVKLDEEFGSEIARVKKEFARMKERSYEEAVEATNKAKIDALKEILPITDNFDRARQVFEPLESDSEKEILGYYDVACGKLTAIIEDFGCVKFVSLGQPYDFNFMEAIMAAPSTEYAKDVVCTEYQSGYKMGDKCVRPAMVVVSTGPGPG